MSLATDSIFVDAISSNQELMAKIGGRLYGTSIPIPDEELDNAPLPYVIVTFEELANEIGTKDDLFESSYDTVHIGIEMAAKSLTELHELTQYVRKTVLSYFRSNETAVNDYNFSASAITFVPEKPCYAQAFRYQCDVTNIHDDGQD